MKGPKRKTDTITISWKTVSKDPPSIAYFADGEKTGDNDRGFEKILTLITSAKNVKKIILKVSTTSLGGQSLEDTLPFGNRFEEFKKAIGAKKLYYEMV